MFSCSQRSSDARLEVFVSGRLFFDGRLWTCNLQCTLGPDHRHLTTGLALLEWAISVGGWRYIESAFETGLLSSGGIM